MKETLLRHDLAVLLKMQTNDLQNDFALDSLEQWDSFTIVSLMGAISQHYQTIVSFEAMMKCKTVNDIFKLAQQQE